jgi:hypothetical protein
MLKDMIEKKNQLKKKIQINQVNQSNPKPEL